MKYAHKPEEWSRFFASWFEDPENLKRGRMTSELYPYEKLFEPIMINRIKVKNRIVMAPMGNVCMCEESGKPSEKMIEYFAERARGGVGLITTGLIPVGTADKTLRDRHGHTIFPRIDRRTNWSAWRDCAKKVQAHGAKFFVQLSPGLGRNGSPESLYKGKLPVSSSINPNFYASAVPCRPLLDIEIRKLIKDTGQAAADSKAMLADGVYLHGHMGYLIEQLTDPAFNRRKRGRYADWQRFGIELVEEVRRRVGPNYPIMYRIDLSLMLKATYGERLRKVPQLKKFGVERSVDQTLELMLELVKAGVDIFDVDLGCYDNLWLPHLPGEMPPGTFLDVAATVKQHFAAHEVKSNAGMAVPVVAVGKLGYPDLAEGALRSGQCDMVMLGRPLLADPYWPNKAYAGRVQEIIPCIGDGEGCIHEYTEGGHPVCAVNPRTAFEDVYPQVPPRAKPRRVAVVGAGPAGIMCACTAAERGHDVTLFERAERPGGTLLPGSVPPIKFDVVNYVDYLAGWLKHSSAEHGLKLKFGQAVDAAELKRAGFDVIVTASGAKPIAPPIEGIGLAQQAVDLLRDPAPIAGAERIVIIGGGVVGCEVAHWLAWDHGKRDVTVIEMLPHFMLQSNTPTRGYMLHHLEMKGVKLLNCTRLKRIEANRVVVDRDVAHNVPDAYNTWRPLLPDNFINPLIEPFMKPLMKAPVWNYLPDSLVLPDLKRHHEEFVEQNLAADLVILSMGVRPDDALYEECVRLNAAAQVVNIGDSSRGGRVLEANKAGYEVGLSI